jgi:hypothetical protein
MFETGQVEEQEATTLLWRRIENHSVLSWFVNICSLSSRLSTSMNPTSEHSLATGASTSTNTIQMAFGYSEVD